MENLLQRIINWFKSMETPTPIIPPQLPTISQNETVVTNVDTFRAWDTPANCKHNVRVLCDLGGLELTQKNLICAVIQGESGFDNSAKNENKNSQGIVTSTDWGICQINDRYHIGLHFDFPSIDYVLQNPDKAVQFMISMFLVGKLSLWCAYQNGSYKKYL